MHYMAPSVQNELLDLMAGQGLSNIQAAGYYSLMIPAASQTQSKLLVSCAKLLFYLTL